MQDTVQFVDDEALHFLYSWCYKKVALLQLTDYYTHFFTALILLFIIGIVLTVIDFVIRRIVLRVLKSFILKSKTKLDDILVKNNVFDFGIHLIPLTIALNFFPFVFTGFPNLTQVIVKFISVIIIITTVLFFRSIFKSFRDFARTHPPLADKPIDSYFQVVSIVLYFIGAISIFVLFTGKSPVDFLLSLGAASAILMLVFKDTIMGFVASIQVSANDMIRVGDWIEMSKFGADGTVLEINLNTVKVQNFDKTITTIPTHLLISDSFKNYRGMQNSGGRRIKRSINIKIASIRFLEPEEIEELKKIRLLKSYIEERSLEIEKYNRDTQADPSMPVNGRKMTNIGLFRAYVLRYAQQNPNIHKEHALMVRQLQPTEHGLPIELYMFTNDVRWVYYEAILSDLFDHLFASTRYFKLEVFESPSSADFRNFKAPID